MTEEKRLLRREIFGNGDVVSNYGTGDDHEDQEQQVERHQQLGLNSSSLPPQFLNRSVQPYSHEGSLDFERVVNEYSIQATRDRLDLRRNGKNHIKTPLKPSTRRQIIAIRWILTSVVGLATALTTILIVSITSSILDWKTKALDQVAQSKVVSDGCLFVGFSLFNLVLALSSSLLCIYVAPEGTGSGIPEVAAYLNGVRVKFTSWRLFGVKILGTILSVSSSLAVGMEGPLVHIGAIVGASFSKLAGVMTRFLAKHPNIPMANELWSFTTKTLSPFSLDAEGRDLVSVGASVGFAASFGAPIGGLLFILAEISSYFSKNMLLRTLVANAIGSFCLAIRSGSMSNFSIIDLGTYEGTKNEDLYLNQFQFVPLFILIGIGGGVLGGFFCWTFEKQKIHLMDRLTSPAAKLAQVAVLSLLTSSILFGLPIMAWTCKAKNPDLKHQGGEFFCDNGEVNEMATIMFGSRGEAIKRILSNPRQFQPETLWTVGIVFYLLMTLTFGSTIPAGIFTPGVLSGAALGGAAGLFFQDHLDCNLPASTFALVGVAAMLAGMQRSTVSICVILVEGTGHMNVLLITIIVVIVARYIAGLIHREGIFGTCITLKGYLFLSHDERPNLDVLQVREIMSKPPKVVFPYMQAIDLVRMLESTTHHGFPVVDPDDKSFLGLVRRDQIIALLECGIFEQNDCPGDSSTAVSAPGPGIAESPLMHWAFHIRDDRYDHLEQIQSILEDKDEHKDPELNDAVQNNLRSMPAKLVLESIQSPRVRNDRIFPIGRTVQVKDHQLQAELRRGQSSVSNASNSVAKPDGFARLGIDQNGILIVTWLHPDCHHLYVNVATVMNQGSFAIPEQLPVSKLRCWFTQLGLRHAVVTGRHAQVTGMVTRSDLWTNHIFELTGVCIS